MESHETDPIKVEITDTLDLHTFHPRDVKDMVQEYLISCVERRFRYVRIIHGKGTGVQKELVRKILAKSEYVETFEDGPDWGSTAVTLKFEGTNR